MKKRLLAVLCSALAAAPVLAAAPAEKIVGQYYDSVNILKALVTQQELSEMAEMKGDPPLQERLAKAGIVSKLRVSEILSDVLLIKKFQRQDDGAAVKGLLGLPTGADGFLLLKHLTESGDRLVVSLSTYGPAKGQNIDQIKALIIADFERGKIGRGGVLKRIAFKTRTVIGSREDNWILRGKEWQIEPSAVELIQ
jgi:hypothetical protein